MNAENLMTEPAEVIQATHDTASSFGAGEQLRRAREAAGLHVGALAVMLKVPVQRLEALEAERWDLLPDTVFVRALASSVCRVLKVDPAPMLLKLPPANPQPIEVGTVINTPFRGAPGTAVNPHGSSQFSRPLVLAVGALLLGALALALFPSIQLPGKKTQGDEDSAKSVSALPAPDSKSASAEATPAGPTVSTQPMSRDSAPGVPQSNVSVSATSLSGSPTTPAELTVSAERSPGSAQPVSGEAIVVFSARGSSWIQVTDATGAAVLKKELGPGETAGASGVLPLAVVIGRADMTTVEVRGKPMDLAAVAKNNVARFEVKE